MYLIYNYMDKSSLKYCVYLTKYSGDLLPPNYIGSTSVKNVLSGKYFGSVVSKRWKDIYKLELKNNPQHFSIEIMSEHDTRIDAMTEELRVHILNDVVKSDQYYNESLATVNGYFGRSLKGKDNPMFGKERPDSKARMLSSDNPSKSQEVRDKISKSRMGQTSWIKGKHHSLESIEKMRLSHIGTESGEDNGFYGKHHTDETKRKISEHNKGNKYCVGKKHTEEAKAKMRLAKVGKINTWAKGRHHTDEAKLKMCAARMNQIRKSKYQRIMDLILQQFANDNTLCSVDYDTLFPDFTNIQISKGLERLKNTYNIININKPGIPGEYRLINI